MKIAPIDIAHKTFARKVMGLDADEVMGFLRDIADQMEELIRERNSMREALRQKELQVMEYRERDDQLKSTIQTAAKMSDNIRSDAEREAKLIINDAQQKAEMIMKDARDQLKRVYLEIADMKRLRMQFEINLRALCQAHVSMIEQSHINMADPQINLSQVAQNSAQAAQMASTHAAHGAQPGHAVQQAAQSQQAYANQQAQAASHARSAAQPAPTNQQAQAAR